MVFVMNRTLPAAAMEVLNVTRPCPRASFALTLSQRRVTLTMPHRVLCTCRRLPPSNPPKKGGKVPDHQVVAGVCDYRCDLLQGMPREGMP